MTLVLMPGMDGTGRLFEGLIQELDPSLSSVVIRYPTDQECAYGPLADLVRERLPSGPFVLFGESFSGPLAIRLAAENPPGLQGVILCASFAASPVPGPVVALGQTLMRLGPRPPGVVLRALLTGRDAKAELVNELGDAIGAVQPRVMAARLREIGAVDVGPELAQVRVPMLYIRATQDRVVGKAAMAQVMAARPDVSIVELEGPHLVAQVQPAAVAEAVLGFCGGWGRERGKTPFSPDTAAHRQVDNPVPDK
ncbi:MAG: alpha/beta fold hydrolase [Myxococcota bacterium]